MDQLILELYDARTIKFGSFMLKSGVLSPVYIDFRSLVRRPKLTKLLAERMWNAIQKYNLKFDVICGVPFGALPFATAVSHLHDVPMLLYRKESKSHGTGNLVEGLIAGERCLIIEDVVTSGSSIQDTVKKLRELGLIVEDCVCLLDREQGASTNLSSSGIKLYSALKLCDLFGTLHLAGKLTSDAAQLIAEQFPNALKTEYTESLVKRCKWQDRILKLQHPTAKRLAAIVHKKRTNLCVAADIVNAADIINLARTIGSEICLLKLHSVAIRDFSSSFVEELSALAESYEFLILEDRKFADIGNTVEREVSCEPYKISSWADAVTAHSVSGPGILGGIDKGYSESKNHQSCCFLILEMSSKENLTTIPEYRERTLAMASSNANTVAGFICQKGQANSGFLYLSPGVNLNVSGDQLGQQFRTPHKAIVEDAVDIIIVGRGVTEDSQPLSAAQKYREAAWAAYEKSVS